MSRCAVLLRVSAHGMGERYPRLNGCRCSMKGYICHPCGSLGFQPPPRRDGTPGKAGYSLTSATGAARGRALRRRPCPPPRQWRARRHPPSGTDLVVSAAGSSERPRTSSVAPTRQPQINRLGDPRQLSVDRPGRLPRPGARANAAAAATDHGARAIPPTAGHARPGGRPVLRDPCPCPPLCRGTGPRALRRDKRHHVETVNVS